MRRLCSPNAFFYRVSFVSGAAITTITQLFAIVNGQQGPRSGTDRMIFKIIAFLAAQGSQRIQEAGQLSSLDIFVPHCVCCGLRRRQVGLDVVVVTIASRRTEPPDARVACRAQKKIATPPPTGRA
jgi:hypothetical protein